MAKEAERIAARKDRSVLLRLPNYFEEAAAIQKVSSLRLDLIDDYFGGVAKDSWHLSGPTIKTRRDGRDCVY